LSYISTRHIDFMFGQVPVWHEQGLSAETVLLAIRVLLARKTDFPFNEITSAVTQIVSKYPPNNYAFVALGASPKMVKWILKQKGYQTVSINVSKVSSNATPPQEFEVYVRRKLNKITKNHMVLFDYVNKGESMAEIKLYLSRLWNKGQIMAVALGLGPDYVPNSKYAQQIDYVVAGIPTLTKEFHANTYKQILGRSKDMRDYATFPNTVKDGEVPDGLKKKYAAFKPSFARAAELGRSNIRLDEFIEMALSESHNSDDAVEKMDGSAQSSDGEYDYIY
jgi:hypothetical protein